MSGQEQNAAIARRYFEGLLNGNVALVDELVSDEVRFFGPNYWGEPIVGREGFRGFVAYLRAAFPDIAFTVHDEVADARRVATRFSFTATHEGEWMGMAATGRRIALAGIDLFVIEGGKIAEIRVFYDTLGLMEQLGRVPDPAMAGADR